MDNHLIARELVRIARSIVAAEAWTDGDRTEGMFKAVCEYLDRKGFNAVKRNDRSMEALYARNVKPSNTNSSGLFDNLHYSEQNEIVEDFKKTLGKTINLDGEDVEVDSMRWDDIEEAMFAVSEYNTWIDNFFKAAGGVTFLADVYADNAGHVIIETYCMLGRTNKVNPKTRLQKLDMAPLRNFEDVQDVGGWLNTNLDRDFREWGR